MPREVMQRSREAENGLTVVEVLVAATLLAVVGVSITQSSIMITQQNNRTVYRSQAIELATDKLEELATINPELLSDDLDESQTLTHEGHSFTRIVNITIRSNRARHALVTVRSDAPGIDVEVVIENSFALWGRR
jgi:Tfp pilus assembly protein PilV